MGRFVNPDNSAFQDVLNSKVYVDKTGLLEPDANISDEGLSISRDKVADSVQDVTDWAKSLDLSEK